MSKILIIEDDVYNQGMLTTLLERNGYNAKAVFDGTDGIKAVKEEKFDLIILDMHLADIDGCNVVKQLKTLDKDIPFIGISGGGLRHSKDMTLLDTVDAMGAFKTFEKPFNHIEFIKAVQDALKLKKN